MKKEKHEFSQIEIKFLGQLVSKKQIQMDGSKVATIQDWPFPIKVIKLCSFLELANYYRRFIKDYSKIAIHLTNSLKKEKEWRWGLECQTAFQRLKDVITLEHVLRLVDLELSFEV